MSAPSKSVALQASVATVEATEVTQERVATEEAKVMVEVAAIEASPAVALDVGATWIGRCADARHPTLQGRVLCEVATASGELIELWIPTLHGLSVRVGDQLLLTRPANWSEPVVVGVLDGFARRPEVRAKAAATLALHRDEAMVIESQDGVPLCELRQAGDGPVVRLLHDDVHLELAGALRVSAKSIALAAREGEARVEAAADVVVTGETIHLN